MERLTLELPTMYGDHHVSEVRRLLFELPGVVDVYASSSFHIVEIQYEENEINAQEIETTLAEAGYLGDLPVAVEEGAAAPENGRKSFFRHTVAYSQTGQVVSFAQKIPYSGPPLWPCPGFGVIPIAEEEHTDG